MADKGDSNRGQTVQIEQVSEVDIALPTTVSPGLTGSLGALFLIALVKPGRIPFQAEKARVSPCDFKTVECISGPGKFTGEPIEVMLFKPTDKFGREVCIGDRVRVVQMPGNIAALPRDMQRPLWKSLGRIFMVKTFGKCGHAELQSRHGSMTFNTIWVEPGCLELIHGGPKKSGAFRSGIDISTM